MKNLSWQKKLFLFFGLVALLPLAISGWNMISISEGEAKASTNLELSTVAGQIAQNVNTTFSTRWFQPLLLVKTTMENPAISPGEKQGLINSLGKRFEDLVGLELYLKQGESYISALRVFNDTTAAKMFPGAANAEIELFSQETLKALDNSELAKGNPYSSKELGAWVMDIAMPVTFQGARVLLAAKINMRVLQDNIRSHYYNNNGTIYLISRDGSEIFSDSPRDLAKVEIVQNVKSLLRENNRVLGTTAYSGADGESVIGCYAFPENLDWGIIAEIKEETAYAQVRKVRNTLFLWLLFGLVLAGGGGLLFSREISKPIIMLSDAAKTISSGNFDIKVDYHAKDSIGVLGSTLVNMSQSLKQSFEKIAEQNRQLEEYNRTLEQKVEERTLQLKEKNDALEITLQKLKDTQEQLIMQQKLASLGQLTAGIAHEIKNPLNFVNNFAKLSVGLVDELREEIERSEDKKELPDFGYLEEILGDIQTNVKKIGEHGSRADNIVKNMLEHSRTDSGEFASTDINKLLDESLSLSYHGIKTNIEDFNADLQKSLDGSITSCKLNPQALSQVFINLFNNSFYAMQKRTLSREAGYFPVIHVASKSEKDAIKITIRDNGTGMPEEVRKKVFEPFFTTKPTGEGTGLGLSISFDIINQMHRGEMSVESKEGDYTEFVITLPTNLE